MSYTIDFVPKDDHLHVTVSGDNNPETITNYLSDVLNTVRRDGQGLVLIEENLLGPSMKIFDIFDIVTKASENINDTRIRIAYIDINKEHDRKGLQFAETVAQNRGINVKIFNDRASALRWLLNKNDPSADR